MSFTEPYVSVIIPARNASSTIAECLLALRAQSYPRERFEVIVVDDGSTDNTADVAAKFWARVVSTPPAGPAAARNRGVKESKGEILLFTDSDCAPTPGWIARLVAAFDDSEVVAARGTYLTTQTSWTARLVQAEYQSRYRRMRERKYIDFIDTYAAAYRRSAFEEAGGFDESFRLPSVEDQELGFRLASRGARMVFCPDAMVAHHHPERPSEYFRKKLKIGYWKMKVLARYPDKVFTDSHTPPSLKVEVASVIGAAATLVPSLFLGAPWLPLVFVASFSVASFPFCRSLWPAKAGLALRAPFFLALRATGLATGMLLGILGRPMWQLAMEKRMERDAGASVTKEAGPEEAPGCAEGEGEELEADREKVGQDG